MGGCLLSWDSLSWATTMLAIQRAAAGSGRRRRALARDWLERLAATPPFSEAWLAHQRRDEFWKQGSVCEDFSAITCPVYMVGGWDDAYRDAIWRLLEGYAAAPRKLIGPWGHSIRSRARPGPRSGFCRSACAGGIAGSRASTTASSTSRGARLDAGAGRARALVRAPRPGRWVAEPSWPPPGIEQRRLALGAARSAGSGRAAGADAHEPAGAWRRRRRLDGPRRGGGLRRAISAPTTARWLSFTSEPLAERSSCSASRRSRSTLAADRPLALIAVRVCDVAPGGASTLDHARRAQPHAPRGHEVPVPLEPGRRYSVEVALDASATPFPPATACACPSPPRSGRRCGPRPRRSS